MKFQFENFNIYVNAFLFTTKSLPTRTSELSIINKNQLTHIGNKGTLVNQFPKEF